MASAMRVFSKFRASDGRIQIVVLSGVTALVAVIALLVGVLPVMADHTESAVKPVVVDLGGGAGHCSSTTDDGRLPSAADNEFHINNPTPGTHEFEDASGNQITIFVEGPTDNRRFRFDVVQGDVAVYDVVVNGGPKSNHYDYDDNVGADGEEPPGPQVADEELHAPTKGNKLHNLSHINICYDVNPLADLSVTKTPVAVNGTLTGNGAFVADVGDTVEFDIVVTNSASSTVAATDVVVTDTLPTGMELSATGNDDWTTESDGTVTQTVDSIPIGGSVTLDLFVTITEDAAGSDLVNAVSVSANENDPTPNNDAADSDPPVTVTADVSGTKYHDQDTDGTQDASEELGLEGWTITAFDSEGVAAATTTTGPNGSYTLTLVPGEYVVCEAAPNQADLSSDDPSKLPDDGTGFTWSWAQSEPSTAECTDAAHESLGYAITVDGDITGLDFGNHKQVSVTCQEQSDVVVTLDGETDEPSATVVFPAGCDSFEFTTSFDLGLSDNTDPDEEDPWTQFVVFGGDPTGTAILSQTVDWAAEPATYVDGNGDECTPGSAGCSLLVPTTQVQLEPGGVLKPVILCSSEPGAPSAETTAHCLDSRVIAEGTPLAAGEVQLTEHYLFLGDPGSFR